MNILKKCKRLYCNIKLLPIDLQIKDHKRLNHLNPIFLLFLAVDYSPIPFVFPPKRTLLP